MAEVEIYCKHDALMNPADLTPHPFNPNVHPKDQIARLAKRIVQTGWRMPVTVSKLSGYVVRGHGRLMAAKEAGLDEVPVDYQDYATEDEEYADLVADNKTFEGSELDQALSGELMEIQPLLSNS